MTTELLTAVLGYDVYTISRVHNNNINVTGNTPKYEPNLLSINIYELMHLMKEWANQVCECDLVTLYLTKGWICCDWYEQNTNLSSKCSTEVEAVTQACQYLLTNKDN